MRLFKRLKLALITAAVSVGAVGALSVNVSDGVGVVSATEPRIKILDVALDDGIVVAESTTAHVLAYDVNVSDGIGTETAALYDYNVDVNDTVGVATDETTLVDYIVTTDDGIGVATDVSVVPSPTVYVDDDIGLVGDVSAEVTPYFVDVNDGVGLFDVPIPEATLQIVVDDALSITAVATVVSGEALSVTVDDGIALATNVTTTIGPPYYNVNVNDDIGTFTDAHYEWHWGVDDGNGIGVEDVVTIVSSPDVDVDDSVGVEDVVIIRPTLQVVVDDGISIDSAAAGDTVDWEVNLDDGIGLTSVATVLPNYSVALDDDIGVTSTTSLEHTLEIDVNDSLIVADSEAQIYEPGVDTNDGVGISDVATVVVSYDVNTSDAVGVTDGEVLQWLGINSSHYDSSCGDEGGSRTAENALGGTSDWYDLTSETHWVIVDLGKSYNVSYVRGRSNGPFDPIDVNIYVSNDKGSFGAAVASGITTWRDRTDWDGNAVIDVTNKDGRYVKVEIITTEFPSWLTFGDESTPFAIFDVAVASPLITVTVDDNAQVDDDIGVEDVVTVVIDYGVQTSDTLGIEEDISVEAIVSIFEVTVNETLGVTEDVSAETAIHDAEEEAEIGVSDYVNAELTEYNVELDDDIALTDWRLHNIPGVDPILTKDLFRFPRLPDDASDELRIFLTDLESVLRTVLTGDYYVGGIASADGFKVGSTTVLGANSSVFQPVVDSTTFFQIKNAVGDIVGNFDTTNKRFGVNTNDPNGPLEVKGFLPGYVGNFSSGQLHVTNASNSEFANAVITGHNSYTTPGEEAGNTQLWYLGSTKGNNNDIAFINRQDGALTLKTNNAMALRLDSNLAASFTKIKLTEIGGYAIKMTNQTDAVSVAGKVVECDHGADDAVELSEANSDHPIGVFLDSGVANGSEAWIVVAGIASVLYKDTESSARGNWVYQSDTAGFAIDGIPTPGHAVDHWKEIGHCCETVTYVDTIILARCVLHFN